MFNNQEGLFGLIMKLNVIAIKISIFSYIVLSIIQLRNYKRNLKNEFSYTEKINLDWIKYLIIGMAVIWIVILSGKGDWYIYSAVVLFIIFIGYFGIKQIGIFSQNRPDDIKFERQAEFQTKVSENQNSQSNKEKSLLKDYPKEENSEPKKYQKSPLSAEAALEIHERVKNIMSSEKLFKNEELTLNQLADVIKIHPNYLSQVINTYEKKNFYEYINELRIFSFINAVKLPENKKYTYLSLAYDCGFNSKSSFNRNFKKVTGISPSEYFSQKN
jgi:AraC-like DNA-binding protein